MLNPSPFGEEPKAPSLGGSMRVNGEPVLRRLRIPMRFRVGERPAGAEDSCFEKPVSSFGAAGERAVRIGLFDTEAGEATGFKQEKSFGEGGALVRKKLTGFV